MTAIDATFTIDSASAAVSGEKQLAPGAQATGSCNASGEQPAGPRRVTYGATIAPATGGRFSGSGTADLGVTSTPPTAQFLEAFFSQQTATVPAAPTKAECKQGGWEAVGFRNQGQRIKAAKPLRRLGASGGASSSSSAVHQAALVQLRKVRATRSPRGRAALVTTTSRRRAMPIPLHA